MTFSSRKRHRARCNKGTNSGSRSRAAWQVFQVTGTYLTANGLNESYGYDAFGNLQAAGNFSFVQAYTAANQLSGWSYDAAGNLLMDGAGNVYTYDANGMVSTEAAAGVSYIYDAEGNRVEKAFPSPGGGPVGVDTIYFGGRPLARLAGTAWTDLIYAASGLLAEVPGTQTGAQVYRITDHLGSAVGTLSSTGVVLSTQDYAPFGQLFTGGTADPYQFTGKERDAESGNDYFGARYYASSAGRWMSPDPGWLKAANAADPQSWNLYGYVLNQPLVLTDPDGMAPPAAGGPVKSRRGPDRGTSRCAPSIAFFAMSGRATRVGIPLPAPLSVGAAPFPRSWPKGGRR
ncbi:MAG: RHS repeat-associated core domain-containing protein [Terracidiphilus sp.]